MPESCSTLRFDFLGFFAVAMDNSAGLGLARVIYCARLSEQAMKKLKLSVGEEYEKDVETTEAAKSATEYSKDVEKKEADKSLATEYSKDVEKAEAGTMATEYSKDVAKRKLKNHRLLSTRRMLRRRKLKNHRLLST